MRKNKDDFVDELAGEAGWWNADNADVFRDALEEMTVSGMTEEQAMYVLDNLYHAVASEYGE